MILQEKLLESFCKFRDKIAIEYGDKTLTYRELDERSACIARDILSLKLEDEAKIGIYIENKIDLICTMIGILRARCIFVPLDFSYPEERTKHMIKKADIKYIFTDDFCLKKLMSIEKELDFTINNVLINDLYYKNKDKENFSSLCLEYNEQDKIYIFFTSGSTGNPKAILGKNCALSQFINWEINEFGIDENSKISQFTSQCHDPFLRDIFVPLFAGGIICVPYNGLEILEENNMKKWIEESKVNLIHCTPSLFDIINSDTINKDSFKMLKYILLAGEKVTWKKVSKWVETFDDKIKLVNLYGPTETTLAKMFYYINKEDYKNDVIPIGKPIKGARVVILNENMRMCKSGQTGEIHIRTPFRTFGYYKDNELNSEKFISNPFGKSCDDLIYKTGDLGKIKEDGNIEFVGRIDRQIKLRGYRVELDEIENVLLNLKEIKDVAVIEKKDQNNTQQYLCAFYNTKKIEITSDEIKDRLREVIPEYMIPLEFIKMDKLPFNNNGKIDYKKLEKTEVAFKKHIEKPRTNLEKELINLWAEILKIDEVGIKQRFFDVGGNSLTAMKLISSIYKNYNINLNLSSILDNPSIEILAKRIENSNKEEFISIESVEKKEYYEISAAQKRIYLLSNMNKDDISHNITNGIIIEGKLDNLKVQNIFNELIQRHSAFRTSFIETNGDVFQKINAINEIEIEYYDAEKTNTDDAINKFVRSFDLFKAPLLRIALIKISSNEHVLVTDMHHIISDGTSVVLLMNEFLKLYKGEKLNDIKIEYKDFAAWQNNLFKSYEIEKQKEYWISEFSDNVPVTNIPTDFIRTPNRDSKGKVLKFTINAKSTAMLKNIASDNETTINSVLFTLYSILISKYCNQKDVVIGSLISGRKYFDINNVIGVFTNFLPIKNKVSPDKTFLEVLNFTKNKLINAYENQDYPFEKIYEYANCVKDNSRNPLFDTMLIYHNQTEYISNEKIDGLSFYPYDFRKQISNLDLKLDIAENGKGELKCLLEYSTALFTKEFCERMKGHFINIISQTICNPNKLIKDIDIITELEKQEIVFDFNNTTNHKNNSKKLYELFEENVEKYPDNIAVIFEDKNITYKELNFKANKLARILVSRGIKEDDFVAILMERTDLMMVAIMATWKAGGAYIPIDVNYPSERILNILNDSEASIVIKDNCDGILEKQYLGQVININDTINEQKDDNLNIKTRMNSIAYAIYTSGSTGKPKGAIVEHAGMMNHMQAKIDLLHLDSSSIIAQNASQCFDISVWQFFSALAIGGKTVIISNDDVLNLDKFLLIIKKNNVNILEVVPSYLVELNEIICKNKEYLNKLNYLLVTGEELKKKLIQNWFDIYPNIHIINAYGPTEASDDITHNLIKEVPKTEKVSIGKPIQNLKIYILTEEMQMCPIGIVGELCVEGIGVGRGYINRNELTKKHFCESPFNKNVRMYKTGDLARWLPDGNIEFLGRKDNQVKVRGFRIELGEIETKIQKYDKVSQVAVIVKIDDNHEANLIAYIEPLEDFIVSDLRKYLRNELPEYMIPSSFISVKKMPTTFNGKIDRKALVNIKGKISTGVVYEEPNDELERMLQRIYCEILNLDNVGINDNFFDLGGHSLRATNLVLKIYREASVEVPLSEIFKNSTIKDLAKYIKNVEKKSYKDITKVKEKDYYEASSIQKRIFVLQQMDINSTAYNIPIAISFKGNVDINKLKDTVKMLVKRHESLRTSFDIKDNEVVQIVDKNPTVDVKYLELKNESLDEYLNKFVKPFDLNKGSLMRCELVKVNEGEYVFIMDIHHIVADGSSISILKNDFISLYEGEELSEVSVQYKDYSNWHNNILKMNYINQQEKYWLNEFKGLIPTLNLPTDYARPNISNNEGDIYIYNINRELSQNIYNFCNKTNTTLFMVMFEIFSIMLSKYSNQEEIIIGTVTAGRNHPNLENTVGVFLNNLAIKCNANKELYVDEYLTSIKTKVLNGYDNQEYPINKLIEKLNLNFDTARKPLFDVMMILQNFESANKNFDDITISSYMMKNKKSEYDITLYISEELDGLKLGFEYSTELFKLDTIKKMARCFERVAEQITFDEKKKISDIDIISDVEKHKIMNSFNKPYKLDNEDMTLHQLFEKQVYLNGSNIALIYGDKKITYDELNKKANQLARHIRNILDSKYNNNNRLSVVSVRMDKSIEMIIAILAVLKSGACYLPIDSKYPLERVKYMINDSCSKIILTQSYLEEYSNFDGVVLNVDDEDLFSGVCSNLDTYTTSESLAYIIYTSGTTGNPKGILTEHRNVISYIKTFNNLFFINQGSITLQQASISFDGFVEEVYTVLTTGGKVVIPKDDEIKDAEVLREIIINNNINILSCSPLILDKFNNLEPMKSVNIFLSSSDILRSRHYDKIVKYSDVYNMYGPSETTVCSTVYKCDGKEQDIVPIGKPIDNYNVYIMNDGMNLLPIGVPGEIYIGGNGVARGYLNTDISNNDRFINNNFNLNGRLYRTGDIGMWTDSGDIVYIGRKDDQIKIRGYRVDSREIESELLKLDDITNVSITIINNESDQKEIVAYIVANKKMTISEIRNKLKNTLPEYMIPSYFVQIDSVPMNQNGKVDKKLLPKVKSNLQTGNIYVDPSDENEEMVMNLFKEVLDVDIKISMKDTFFELGGNSIKLAILANRIFEIFNIKINIGDLLNYNTVEDIAKLIKNKFKNSNDEVMIFNENKERILFCFPPIIGYGIIYTQLAKELSDYRINAFNYIEDSNVIQLYADYIIKSQQIGEYELFGYSAGGNLAFEVAKELEKRNKTVTKIIMLDSDIATESIVTSNLNSEHYRREEIKMFLENNKIYRLFANEIVDKTSKFSDYFNANITSGKISSDIYLIKSDVEELKKDYEWNRFTNKQLINIKGYGEHKSMLEDENALKNINIIKQILG